MSDLQWTDEPPKQPGWYYVREPDNTSQAPAQKEPKVVEVKRNRDGVLTVWFTGYAPGIRITRTMNREWAGPIPKPQE